MNPKRMDGQLVSELTIQAIKKEVHELLEKDERSPHLAVIIVGDNPASKTYVKNKIKMTQSVGILSSAYELEESTTQEELIEVIEYLNKDDEIDGILVQLPLPNHIDEEAVMETITTEKDVDGLTPLNVGRMIKGHGFIPCTPKGIMKLLDYYKVDLAGKHVVIVGRSHLVGRPLFQLMLDANATVTVCHSKTKDLKEITKQADILVVAIGEEEFITKDYVSEGVILVDVGINRSEEGLFGDISESAIKKSSLYTPVPKGVGPMTIAMLLANTMEAYHRRENG